MYAYAHLTYEVTQCALDRFSLLRQMFVPLDRFLNLCHSEPLNKLTELLLKAK